MISNIKSTLEQIGLTKGEIQVYVALLKLELSTTGRIAKESKISNSKVYEVLGRLSQKGLVSFVIKNNTRNYKATPPERLLDFLNDKKEEIERNKKELSKIIPSLKNLKATEKNSVTIYEGKQGVRAIISDMISTQEKGYELLTYGSDENIFADKYPDLVNQYALIVQKRKLKSRAIFSAGTKPFSNSENQRYLKKGLISPVRTAIYGNKVAIFKFSEPVSVILIEDKTISDGYKKQFEFLWKISQKNGGK
jgi:sugar-specific transcriptional regulator TrmB